MVFPFAEDPAHNFDKQGMIRFLHVEDINIRPPLEIVMKGLQSFK